MGFKLLLLNILWPGLYRQQSYNYQAQWTNTYYSHIHHWPILVQTRRMWSQEEMEVLLGQVLPIHAPKKKKNYKNFNKYLTTSKPKNKSSLQNALKGSMYASVRPHTLSVSSESSIEKLSDTETEPGELVLRGAGSGVMVLECGGSITTLGEVLTWGRSRHVLFRELISDRREPRTEAWNRSGSLFSEYSSLLKTSGELRDASSRETLTTSSKALWGVSDRWRKKNIMRTHFCCDGTVY